MVAREGVQQPAIRERLISPLLRSCGCGLQGRSRERRRHARRPGMHHKEGHTLHLFVGQTGSRVASGVVSQKIPFIPQLQAIVPELRSAPTAGVTLLLPPKRRQQGARRASARAATRARSSRPRCASGCSSSSSFSSSSSCRSFRRRAAARERRRHLRSHLRDRGR